MTADGARAPGRTAGGTTRREGAGDEDDAPLADLTAGSAPPLADLGDPEAASSRVPLPDLAADADGARPAHPADDDWAPVPPLVDGDPAARPDGTPSVGDAQAEWQPLPDLTGGGRAAKGRRPPARRRTARGTTARTARGSSGSAADAAPSDTRTTRPDDPPAAVAAGEPAVATDGGSSVASESSSVPMADGLPPGALGAGASGARLRNAGDEDAAPDGERRTGGRKGGRRRGRRTDGATGDGAAAGAASDRPLTAEERLQQALTLAYRHLSKRDRTVSEVRAHLEKREIDEPSIVGALGELVAFGYVDDERYAARFVEDKRRLEGWGHLRIEQGLRRTGIPREVADRALADDPLRGEEDDLAVEALDRRLNGRALEDDRARQKALRLLATKGYPLETAYAAVRAYERRCAARDED